MRPLWIEEPELFALGEEGGIERRRARGLPVDADDGRRGGRDEGEER
jgi:hypothetical protein